MQKSCKRWQSPLYQNRNIFIPFTKIKNKFEKKCKNKKNNFHAPILIYKIRHLILQIAFFVLYSWYALAMLVVVFLVCFMWRVIFVLSFRIHKKISFRAQLSLIEVLFLTIYFFSVPFPLVICECAVFIYLFQLFFLWLFLCTYKIMSRMHIKSLQLESV